MKTMCDHEGCTNEATCFPRISFTAVGHPGAGRARLRLDLPLCQEHAIPKADLYLTPRAWQQLTAELVHAGKLRPDINSAEVEFQPIAEMPTFRMPGDTTQ